MRFSHYLLVIGLFIIGCGSSEDEMKKTDENKEPTYSISGQIEGDSPEEVTISIGDQSTQTSSDGSFTITGLELGEYTVTPSKSDIEFVPSSIDVTITENITELDFLSIDETGVYHAEQVWRKFNPDVYSIPTITETDIRLDLAQNALWFEDDEGGLIYQEVTGDFTITASVKAQKSSNYTETVECFVCLGGLMARNSDDSNGENYVHIVTGETPNGLGVETKNTIDGESEYVAVNDGSAEFDLRMCRSGSTFSLYKKETGTTEWQLAATHVRSDLPETLQVGINIYTYQSGDLADLSVLFSDIFIEASGCD